MRPNRRGVRSREAVLDAAERLMAERGYDAATVARIVEASGIPMSSVYHYFGSKDGVLLAVMERGAERFFASLPPVGPMTGPPDEYLADRLEAMCASLDAHPDFLRLLLVFAVQHPAGDRGQVEEVVGRVRRAAQEMIRGHLGLALGAAPDDRGIDGLARFVLAAIDGAFVAHQADPATAIAEVLAPLPLLAAAPGGATAA